MSHTPHRQDTTKRQQSRDSSGQIPLDKLTFSDSLRKGLTAELERSFSDALHLLDQSPVRAHLWERHEQLKAGVEVISEATCCRALERFTRLPSPTQRRLVTSLLKSANTGDLFAPVSHYAVPSVNDDIQKSEDPRAFTRLGVSLLLKGIPSREEFVESLELREMTLLDSASDGIATTMMGLAALTGPTFWYLFSPTLGIVSAASLLSAAYLDMRHSRIALEVVRGYTQESLEAYNAITSGQMVDLGETLNNIFRNTESPENLQNDWRTEGFLLARVLRLFGHSPEKIFSLFKDDARVDLPFNDLVSIVRSDLAGLEAPTPPSLMMAYDAEENSKEYDKMCQVLASLNEAYLINELFERQRIRCEFAAKVLAMRP